MVEHLRKMANNRKGQRSTEEHCRKIAEALTGRPLSEEHRRKMAAINADPELRKQRSQKRISRRKAAETHRQLHKRLATDRGPAVNHQCVDCHQPAHSWTHNWSTWEDVAQDIHGKRLTFSTNMAVYEPRCHPCHNKLDRCLRPWDLPLEGIAS